jgi:T5orf172 domain
MAAFEVMLKCEGCGRHCRATISDSMNSPTLRCSACGYTLFEARAIRGYVYLLSNSRMPGLLKIGCTARPVSERVQELNGATGVPEPFVVEAYFESSSPEQHEAQIHRRLAAQRVKGKEFFEVDLAVALKLPKKWSNLTRSTTAGSRAVTGA